MDCILFQDKESIFKKKHISKIFKLQVMVIYEVTTLYMLDTNMTYDIYSYYMQSTDCIISTREITLKEFTNE